jgi:hypothetical protein
MEAAMIDGTTFVQIDEVHYHNFYRVLCRTQDDTPQARQEKPFPRMVDLFVWAAVKGLISGKERGIDKRYSTPPFRWQVVPPDQAQTLICLTVARHGHLDVLAKPVDIKETIEKYATAGIDMIAEEMSQDPFAYRSVTYLVREALGRRKE